MKTYTIKKGKHSFFKFPKIVFNKKIIKVEIMFTDSCKYNLGNKNQLDWNKIIGFSRGFHHHNSARLAWRWNPILEKIEITKYYYINKKRVIDEDIIVVDLNKIVKLSIMFPENIRTCKIGYILFPFFGGNETAPHDINISLAYE